MNKVFQGQDDGWILQNFRVRTGTMPSVLAASPGPQPPAAVLLGSLFEKQEEKNQIELLGKVAPSVKGPDSCDNLALYFSPQCNGYRQQKEAQAEAARQKSKALNPDGITGTWLPANGRTQLRIWKQGDLYLGSMSGETGMVTTSNLTRSASGSSMPERARKGRSSKDSILGLWGRR